MATLEKARVASVFAFIKTIMLGEPKNIIQLIKSHPFIKDLNVLGEQISFRVNSGPERYSVNLPKGIKFKTVVDYVFEFDKKKCNLNKIDGDTLKEKYQIFHLSLSKELDALSQFYAGKDINNIKIFIGQEMAVLFQEFNKIQSDYSNLLNYQEDIHQDHLKTYIGVGTINRSFFEKINKIHIYCDEFLRYNEVRFEIDSNAITTTLKFN